jgi:prophage antirepressor-like protein
MEYKMTAKPRDMTTCTFREHPIRVASINGTLWFVAYDVLTALSYWDVKAIDHIPQEWKRKYVVDTPGITGGDPVDAISESGLYFFLGGSLKPEARSFQKWLMDEALPAIRVVISFGAAKRIREAQAIAAKVAERVARETFEFVLNDSEDLRFARYIVALSHDGEPEIYRMADNERVTSLQRLSDMLDEGSVNLVDLQALAKGAVNALDRRVTWIADRKSGASQSERVSA